MVDMSNKMMSAPIFYMIGQVRFSPVLRMGDFVSSIQGDLRRQFPDFVEQQLQTFEFQISSGGGAPEIVNTPTKRWHFKDVNGTSGYILSRDSLSFHTTAYNTSEHFMDLLLVGLKLVNERVDLSYVEGWGIRSLDAVVPTEGRDLDFYVKANLLGLYGRLDGQFIHSIFETSVQNAGGRLASKAVTLVGKLGISADLAPMMLKVRPDLLNLQGRHIVLDNDCSQTERIAFDLEEILKRLRLAKKSISEAFYAAVTDDAVALWKERLVQK